MVSKELVKTGFRKLLTQFHEQPAAIMVFDENGNLQRATRRALDLFEVKNKAELPARKLVELFKEPNKKLVLTKLIAAARDKKDTGASTLLRRKTPAGFKDVSAQFSVKKIDDHASITAHLTDVGDLFERGAVMDVFGIAREINSQTNLDSVFQEIAKQSANLFNAKVFVMQLEGDKLHLKGLEGVPFTDAKKAEWIDVNGKTLLAAAARTRQMQEHPSIKELPGAAIQDIDEKHDFGHSVAIPLIAKNGNGEDTLLGVVGLYKTGDDRFFAHELELLKFVSEVAVTKISSTRLTEKLKHQATHDALTTLLNRRGFFELMAKTTNLKGLDPKTTKVAEILPKLKKISPFRMVFMDLNNLKRVNDVLGHLRGNEAIQLFADYLTQSIPGAIVARMGGDEFAAFIPGIPNEDPRYAAKFEKQFKLLMESPKYADLKKVGFNAAFGHADFTRNPEHEKSVDWTKLIEDYAKSGKTLFDLSSYLVNAAERAAMHSKRAEKIRLGYAPPEFLLRLLETTRKGKIGEKEVLELLAEHGLTKEKPA